MSVCVRPDGDVVEVTVAKTPVVVEKRPTRVRIGDQDGRQGPAGPPGPGAGFLNEDPTTITVGGIPAGSTFPTQHSVQEMFDQLLYPYQIPSFTAFSIAGVSSPLEVGASFGPNVTFTWSTSQPGNIEPNTVDIYDLVTSDGVATGLANDGSQAVTLPDAITRTTAGTYGFSIGASDLNDDSIERILTLTWQWRRYYGASANTTLTGAQILALANNGLATGYAGSYPMAAGGYKFIALAAAVGSQINSVRDASTQLSVPMAPGSFTDGGGYGYELVNVTNVQGVVTAVRLYRTLNALGSTVTLAVT